MKIFVGNLGRDITESDLREVFGPFGDITSVAVLKDKFTGEPRGFGFVVMNMQSQAQAAISALHGMRFKGKILTVNEARPKASHPRGVFGHRSREGGHRGGSGNAPSD